ncbi:MAG: hypothetical protein CL512_05160 [Actinobacteria bacterium]|nr:hypothetical protein [Actinomycetota bacterium]
MHISVQLGEANAELDSGAIDSLIEHIADQYDWQEMLYAYSNVVADIANDNMNIHDEVSDILTSHDFYYDVRSRLEDLENGNDDEGEYWANNKYALVESLLNEYNPQRDCSTGTAFTNAVERAVGFNTPRNLEENQLVAELQAKVGQLEETLATLLQALSMTGRLAGEQFGLTMFSEASKRASEASRNAYQNEVADESRKTDMDAVFEIMGNALGGEV